MELYSGVLLIFLQGGWYMGNFACNVWLGVDYVASNASVLNLLIICIDRFVFSMEVSILSPCFSDIYR